jgi:hypothetical protein
MKTLFFLLSLSISITVAAQATYSNTVKYSEIKGSPKASLDDMDFIVGHWRGEAFGGITEEIWSPALGGSMMCSFKLVAENKVLFYEICTISEEEGSLILRLKHFNGNLTGWEEKEETVDFRLVKVTKDKVYFDEFTFEKVSEDEMNIYVVIQDGGEEDEVKFNYKKFKGQ